MLRHLCVIMALLLGLAACGTAADDQAEEGPDGSGEAANGEATADDGLIIYTARASEITDEIIPMFEDRHPEYAGAVDMLNMGAQEVLERVRAESGNPQGDVWWGGTQQQFDQAADDGLLAELDESIVEQVPEEYRHEESLWVGEILLPEVIMYNSEALSEDEVPTDWDDLLDEQYAGEILIRDVAASGTMRTIFASMILHAGGTPEDPEPGYDWLLQLDANTTAYAADPSDLYLRLARQEGSLSAWNLQDILIEAEQNDLPFDYVIPESGAPLLVDGVGAIADSPNPNAAQTFIEFLFEEDVRRQLSEDFFQVPVNELEEEPAWLAELELNPMEVDFDVLAENEEEWISYWEQNIKNRGGE